MLRCQIATTLFVDKDKVSQWKWKRNGKQLQIAPSLQTLSHIGARELKYLHWFFGIWILEFGFVWCFDIRISNLFGYWRMDSCLRRNDKWLKADR